MARDACHYRRGQLEPPAIRNLMMLRHHDMKELEQEVFSQEDQQPNESSFDRTKVQADIQAAYLHEANLERIYLQRERGEAVEGKMSKSEEIEEIVNRCQTSLLPMKYKMNPVPERWLRNFLPFTTFLARRRPVTTEELRAQAEANGYNGGAHKEADETGGREKHIGSTKKNHDGILRRYVLWHLGVMWEDYAPEGLSPSQQRRGPQSVSTSKHRCPDSATAREFLRSYAATS
ncbi:MAG: hypothetical protein M1816_005988 [Peltula sp. TS41687]|nr:MAG: hypothetical protein M1816_005988 [Peltula sp. TS41687]